MVKKIKGNARPVNNQEIRKEQLDGLKMVDLSIILPEKFDSQSDWGKNYETNSSR